MTILTIMLTFDVDPRSILARLNCFALLAESTFITPDFSNFLACSVKFNTPHACTQAS